MDSAPKRDKVKKFIWYHLPVILYAGVVITVSSISNLNKPEIRFLAFDKIAHFFEYAIFAVLAYRSISNLPFVRNADRAFYITTLFLILFATFDEYFVQSLSRRTSSIYDLAADLVGALLVLILLRVFHKNQPKSDIPEKAQKL